MTTEQIDKFNICNQYLEQISSYKSKFGICEHLLSELDENTPKITLELEDIYENMYNAIINDIEKTEEKIRYIIKKI